MFFSLLTLLGKLIVSNVFPSERLVNRSRSANNSSFVRDAPGNSRVWRMKSCPHIRELDLDSTLWSPDSRDWIPDSFSVKLGFRILDLDSGLHMVKFPRFKIPEAKVSPIRGARRWCYTVRFATTIFSATQCCNIVWNIYNIVPTLQRCVALKIVVANRTV